MTFWICWASSRVGARTRAWHSRSEVSMRWRIEMAKVAVLPVPDWAWAITSRVLRTGTMARCWMAEGFSKLCHHVVEYKNEKKNENSVPIGVDATEELLLEAHVVKVLGDLIPVGLEKKERRGQIEL